MSDIPAELSLDVTSALAAVAQIDTALQTAAASFQATLETAFSTLNVTTGVDVPVDFDVPDLSAEIAQETASSAVTVPVDGDVSPAQSEIDTLSAETVVVAVDADTSGAQQELANLSGATGAAGANIAGFAASARSGFDAAGAAVTGNVQGMTKALGTFGPVAAGAGAAIVTLAGVGKVLVGSALEAESALQRFNTTTGLFGATIRAIDIGGLNQDLADLALSLGSDDEAALNAASSIFELGRSSGVAAPQVAETTKQIEALAARAVALKPSLGSVGDVSERLLTGLARGGRFASQFNISLTQADITARALQDNIGKTADELTIYDKAAAGAALATERLGDRLSTDIQRGSENVAIQFAAVKQSFQETLEAVGKPLLGPTLEGFKAAQPIVKDLAEVFGSLLQVVIPLASAFLDVLKPALDAIVPLLDTVAKAGGLIAKAFKISALPITIPAGLIGDAVDAIGDKFSDSGDKAEDGGAKVAEAVGIITDALGAIPRGLAAADELGTAFGEVSEAIAPLTASEANLRAETTRLAVGLANGTASAKDFRRAFQASGLDVGSFTESVKQVIAERDRLASSFDAGLPSIGDAFQVEAVKVASGAKVIDKSFQQLADASDELRDRLSQGLPNIADAFKEGVSPEDLRDAQTTLEAFIQGVEGVSKSAADAAQAVIDKAAIQGGTGLSGFLETLRKQTAEIAAFQGTLATLRGRGATDLAAVFAERGVESAAVAAEAAGLSETDLAAAEATVEQAKNVRNDAVKSMGLFADQLVATFGPKGAEAGTVFGEGLVTALGDPAIVEAARKQAEAIGNATTEGAASSVKAQPQTLAGFLAALKSQSGDIEAFQADLDTIARNGGQVLADTLRTQGITAANAAAQAAGLAPAQLVAAEQAVRDAQTVLGTAETNNKAAADRLVQFMADTAARATAGFTDSFVVQVGPLLGTIGADILADTTLTSAFATAGAASGVAYGGAFTEAVTKAITTGGLGGILLGAPGSTLTLPAVALPPGPPGGVANVQAGFGTGTSVAQDQSVPSVIIENVNVTPPRDATADEQANAISDSLAWKIRGPR